MDKGTNAIFTRVLLTEKVKLEPVFLTKGYRDEVLKRLQLKVEGVCTKHGYIRPESIEIHKVCIGRLEVIGLNGNTTYDVQFWADVCNPLLGSVIRCKVSNVNKFGILAEAEGVVEAIVAKNSVNIQSDIDLDKIRIGDDILIEVLGKKFELNDKKISVIGKAVRDVSSNASEIRDKSTKRVAIEDEEDEEVADDLDPQAGGSDTEDDESEDNETDVDNEEEDEEESDLDDALTDSNSVKEADGRDENFFSEDEDDWFKSDEEFSVNGDDDDGDASESDEDSDL